MARSDRTDTLMGFEGLGLLAGTRRAGNWSGSLPEITGLSVDSRRTQPGQLFAALPGVHVHGGTFISYALRMGAAAVLTDPEGLAIAEAELGPLEVPVVLSDSPRRTLAIAASRWSGRQPETVVAVTGTNGKTSV
ncbi:MAG: UDP-N-acetylmuramoyl-L-alanyl-D-glutamate--2,6-diaminopimelate ligase, partial [Rhodobacteraceae bacterium]|nr:UDP-N-acetylmuramoyl-L-alanyl-D-glutamate--2,6-diaminopimelate ligase [Paracoccaceae bacterium]